MSKIKNQTICGGCQIGGRYSKEYWKVKKEMGDTLYCIFESMLVKGT